MNEIMTAKHLADFLHIHVRTVYRLARKGEIPAAMIGGQWRFNRTVVLESMRAEMGSDKGEPLFPLLTDPKHY